MHMPLGHLLRTMARQVLPVLLALVLVTACATPKNLAAIDKAVSHAYPDYRDAELLRPFSEELAARPGESGFVLVPRGDWGFQIRAGLALAAAHTIDAQYYIWHPDKTGRILTERLVAAADRGVRVRVIIDDLQVVGRDRTVAMLDTHPNIELRVFNPITLRSNPISEALTDFSRINRRMHNKVFIVDNALAVVGGRNVGDDYFGVNDRANFRDLDLLAVGPVVQDVSASFDTYWNSIWAVPIGSLLSKQPTAAESEAGMAKLRDWVRNLDDFPYDLDTDAEQLRARLAARRGDYIWGRAETLYDPPDKVVAEGARPISERLRESGAEARREILIEMAYFIPGAQGIANLHARRDEDIRIRVLTNSLASNDVIAAHAGYARYWVPLLENGVELYEMRADAAKAHNGGYGLIGSAGAALHTKAAVIDRRKVFIGSYNFDPRSHSLNTEIGLLVHSPELAAQVADFMDAGVSLEQSYRVEKAAGGDAPVTWVTIKQDRLVRYTGEPAASFWRQLQLWLVSLLPIEGLL